MRLAFSLIASATSPSYQFYDDTGLIATPITSGITAIAGTPLYIVASATRPGGATGVYFTCTEGVDGFEDFTDRDQADALTTSVATLTTAVDTIDNLLDTEIAAIKAKTDNLPAAPAAVGDIPTALQNADALLNRDMSAVSDTNARSPLNALRFLRNLWAIAGTTLTVKKEDDSTTAWTATMSTDAAAVPITGSDPA